MNGRLGSEMNEGIEINLRKISDTSRNLRPSEKSCFNTTPIFLAFSLRYVTSMPRIQRCAFSKQYFGFISNKASSSCTGIRYYFDDLWLELLARRETADVNKLVNG